MAPTDREIAVRVEQAAAASMRDFFAAAPPDLAAKLDLQMLDIGPAVATCSSQWKTHHVNRVLGLGVVESATEAVVDTFTTFYRAAGVQFAISLSPIARPDALPEWLTTRGFIPASNTTILHRSIEPLEAHTTLRIESIDATSAAPFAAILIEASPLPEFFGPWLAATVGRPERRHYLAFDGATPVAAAMLFIHEKVGVLTFAATLASHRRLGAQRALIARRILDAAALGCTLVITDTAEDTPDNPSWSCRNMQRSGFHITYLRPDYLSPPLE